VAALARHLRAAGSSPDLVICSPAVRARQTLEGVAPGIPPDVAVEIDEALYGGGATALLERLTRLPAGVAVVLVIGHNPGLEELAAGLAGAGDPSLRARMAAKYPTGALATFDTPCEWSDLTWGRAALADFVVPRDLGR
jgi:phosphohistidine phosphatase